MRQLHIWATRILPLLLSACANWSAIDTGSQDITVKEDYTLQAPTGWVKRNYGKYDVFLSRNGPLLNYIAVRRQAHDDELPRIKRKTSAQLLPSDLAELVIAEQKNNNNLSDFHVISNTPARLDGHPGIRVQTQWKTDRGLVIDRLTYALVDQKGRLFLIYEAPELAYYQNGLADFETMVSSLHLK